MEAKVGMRIFFEYCGFDYEREIENITIYKNYSWFGDLGFGGNVAFCVHGDLDDRNKPLMKGLVIQYDGTSDTSIHGYVRTGITFEP
jgi:hypothetical protein